MTGNDPHPSRAPRHRGWLRDRRGGAAVDFALILPFLILMIYGIIEFARLLFGIAVLHFAVEQAARYAVVNSGLTCPSDTSSTQNYAAGYGVLAVGWGVTASDFTVTCSCPGSVSGTSVSISKTFTTPVLELLPSSDVLSIAVGARSCYPT